MRLHVPEPLVEGSERPLPEGAARHAQVRRVQPGQVLTLFSGDGLDWQATVVRVGRSSVTVRVGSALPVHNELPLRVTLALVMPANERMDGLVEKATELGVAAIQPLHGERSVLRLAPERAERKRVHWHAVAQAACEQCGRARLPAVLPVREFDDWLATAGSGPRWLLSLAADAQPVTALPMPAAELISLSGPEGGLSPAEEHAARAAGFVPVALGPRVLRADTAPLAMLAWLALNATIPRHG